MEFLKPLVGKKVLVYLFGGGLLEGKVLGVGPEHLVVEAEADRKGEKGSRMKVERYVPRHAVLYAEEDRGQSAD